METLRKIENYTNIILKIFYYSDILGNLNYKRHEIDQKLHKIDNESMNNSKFIDLYLNLLVDNIKKYILTHFFDLTKIEIMINFYDKNNKYHNFIYDVRKMILKDKNILNGKIKIENSLFILIFDENNKLYFVGIVDFIDNKPKNNINYYFQYIKKKKENIKTKLVDLIKVFTDISFYLDFIDFNKVSDNYYDNNNNNKENNKLVDDVSLTHLYAQSASKDDVSLTHLSGSSVELPKKDDNLEENDFCFPFQKYLTYENNIQHNIAKKEIKNKESYENYIQIHKKYN